jgi:hypothetical protein
MDAFYPHKVVALVSRKKKWHWMQNTSTFEEWKSPPEFMELLSSGVVVRSHFPLMTPLELQKGVN